MTPKQIELARHALGLNYKKTSFRNHFVCGKGKDNDNWEDMVNKGFAVANRNHAMARESDVFHMTPAGIKAVLKRGEKICHADTAAHNSKGWYFIKMSKSIVDPQIKIDFIQKITKEK